MISIIWAEKENSHKSALQQDSVKYPLPAPFDSSGEVFFIWRMLCYCGMVSIRYHDNYWFLPKKHFKIISKGAGVLCVPCYDIR